MRGDARHILGDYSIKAPELCELDKTKTYKGLVGIYVDESKISYIDGENGDLYYRGFNIKELVNKSSFEEVAYLLIHGSLPSQSQLQEFTDTLIKERNIPDNILSILKSFPRETTRIELLRTAISALSLYDPEDYKYERSADIRKGIRIIAKMPTILAFSHRIQSNQPIVEPSDEYSHAGNYYKMMTDGEPGKDFESAFDKILISHAEHGSNASTFSCRLTVSTLSDLYSGITSAIGTLRGPLHGGANERVINYMINEIKREDNVIPWVKAKLEAGEKIMGFGHRVYKTWDPRALILKEISEKIWDKLLLEENKVEKIPDTDHEKHKKDVGNIFKMTEILTEYMIEKKGIYPNVDLYSAGLLHALGIPIKSFTPLFAASRSVGWSAHGVEQLSDNRLIRPRLRYIGGLKKDYIELSER